MPTKTHSTDTAARKLARRDFLVRAAGGLIVGFVLPDASQLGQLEAATITAVNSWLKIGTDESITLTIGSSEMGQGSFSGLAQILAEELMVDYSRIITVQGGPTMATPAPIGSAIYTVGSGVTRRNFWKLRDAAAIAREMLVQAAMNKIGDQSRAKYTITKGVITYGGTKTITYGSVAAAAALLTPPASAPLVPDSQFSLIGKVVPRIDIPSKVDGSAKYGIDIRLPNMVYAIIKHCPTLGGRLASAPAIPPGAIALIPTKVVAGTDRGLEAAGNVNAVAVIGTNTWDAWQAANSLSINWKLPANASSLGSTQFLAQAQALVTSATPYSASGPNPPGTLYTVEGNASAVTAANSSAAHVVDTIYSLPYVAHACMEVLNCTVDYVAGVKCDVYAPTQGSSSVLSLVVAMTGLAPNQVNVHTTFLGGGLGRKAEVDFVSQALQIGMALGRPVKLMWPRDEDFTHDQYRPMALVHAKAGLNSQGQVLGWSYRNISPSILGQRGVPLGPTGDSQGYEGAVNLPYSFGARVTEYVTHPSPIPVGFWRSVGASINTFAAESMIDELAAAAGQDPCSFRRSRLTDPRWIAVLDAVASLSGWYTPAPPGHARGIAIGAAFGSIVAEVVDISNVTSTGLRVNNVWVAMDCYIAVNPGQIEAQLTGGVVHGLNAALYGRQTFVNGAAQNKNFNRSRMIRMGEMPQVAVKLIPNPLMSDRNVAIGGAGELGVPTFAPALANAYFKLTGQRVRSLPFFPNATMGGL
jgi:isoquinoline 1-oxidoreductase beta subunit